MVAGSGEDGIEFGIAQVQSAVDPDQYKIRGIPVGDYPWRSLHAGLQHHPLGNGLHPGPCGDVQVDAAVPPVKSVLPE
jgi:hypothetical protein